MEHVRAGVLASLCLRSELQHRSHLGEGWRRMHHGYKGGLLVEPLAEIDDDDVDELRVADNVTKFVELVVDGLDALAVEVDRCIALGHIEKLGVQGVPPGVAVTLKELM